MSTIFTLWFCYLYPGKPLGPFYRTMLPSDKIVSDLQETVSLQPDFHQAAIELYKAPTLRLVDTETSQITMADLGEPLVGFQSLATVFGPQPAEGHLHVVVVSDVPPFHVDYWIRGQDSIPFVIDAPRRMAVFQLLEIMKQKHTEFDAASIVYLKIYKVTYHDEEDRKRIVRTPQEGEILPNNEKFYVAFKDVPLTKDPCVVLEMDHGGLKRKSPWKWDVVQRALKQPKTAPSSYTASVHHGFQGNIEKRVFDGRIPNWKDRGTDRSMDIESCPDNWLPPIQLLYAGFGKFFDTYEARCNVNAVRGSAALREQVELFAEQMSRTYAAEQPRQDSGLAYLNNIFTVSGVIPGVIHPGHRAITPSNIGSVRTDGHYTCARYDIPYLLTEFKNETGNNAIPAAQLSAYYGRIVEKVAETKPDLVYRSRLPAIGLTVVGPTITFYALAWVGAIVCFALTPGISCILGASGGRDRRALHAAFVAATELATQIIQDAEWLCDPFSPPPLLAEHFFPDIEELSFIDNPDTSFKVKIIDVISAGPLSIVYRAVSSARDIVVKIARSYSADLHSFCAELGYAPKLLAVKRLPGDIVVVAMDYVEGVRLGPGIPQHSRNVLAQQLQQLVEEVHKKNYVHGDLRAPNIHCVGDTIMLLDFDWGGKVGEAFYPPCILNPQLQDGRDMDDLMITKEDDERVLKITLRSIES